MVILFSYFTMDHTRVATLLNALSSVRNASSRISWVDDVALVACGAVKRLISVLGCAAGLRYLTQDTCNDHGKE